MDSISTQNRVQKILPYIFRHPGYRVELTPRAVFFVPGKEGTMSTRNYLTASEVAEIMGVSVPTAYKIIRKLNDELKAAGYITVCGKVSRAYFEHKTYSVSA